MDNDEIQEEEINKIIEKENDNNYEELIDLINLMDLDEKNIDNQKNDNNKRTIDVEIKSKTKYNSLEDIINLNLMKPLKERVKKKINNNVEKKIKKEIVYPKARKRKSDKLSDDSEEESPKKKVVQRKKRKIKLNRYLYLSI